MIQKLTQINKNYKNIDQEMDKIGQNKIERKMDQLWTKTGPKNGLKLD